MKKNLLLFSFVLIYSALCSQDLIVTNERDSINGQILETGYTPQKKADYAHFRMAVAGGYTCIMGYRLNHGYHYGMELNYYFNKNLGIGINYYAYYYDGSYDSETRVQQIIPTFSTRMFDKKKRGALLISVGIGYIGSRNKYWLSYPFSGYKTKFESSQHGIGMFCGIGYDFPFSKTMAVCLQASVISNGLDEIGIGGINLSIGLRFAK